MPARPSPIASSARRPTRVRPCLALAVCAVLAAGCGSGKPQVALHPVQGRLEVGPQPPVGAIVTLHPKDAAWPHPSLPSGTVGADGTFRIGTFGPDDGAPAGDYVATVQWFRVGPDGSVGGNVIPPKFARPESSPFAVAVQPGANDLPPLKVSR